MANKEKFKVLRVTYTEDYYIEMIDDERTAINGWTLAEVIESWFHKFPLGMFHATRDVSCIGNSRRYVKSEECLSKKAR